MASAKAWLDETDGKSVVRQSFDRLALPGEGSFAGVSAEPNGDMYAFTKSGEQKLDAMKGGEYKDAFYDYIRSVGLGRAMKAESMKVLNEGSDSAGGFWVPPDYRNELIKKIAAMSVVRQNATVYTTGSDVISFPKVVYNTATDDAEGKLFTSGVRFGWQASTPLSADISEATNPVAGRDTIPVHTASAALILTREQLEDNSFDILGYISGLMSEAFGLGEESAFWTGNGAGQPWGVSLAPNIAVDDTAGGMLIKSNKSGEFTWAGSTDPSSYTASLGILGLEAALPPQYDVAGRWYASKKSFAAIRGLTDTAGRPLWNQTDGNYTSWVNGYPSTLLGYPIAKAQFVADPAASSKSMYFGDMRAYYVIDRVGLSIEVLRELRALRGEVVVYARKRVGGQLVHDWKMKVLQLTT
jgi:HK97 family phage major capsid protein